MKKFIFAIFAATILSVNAFADTDKVMRVQIEGLQNVKIKTVTSVIELKKKGMEYSDDIARSDVRAILDLGSFEDVEFNFNKENGTLSYIVTEKPYIKKINFKGNKQFSSGKLKSESTLKEKQYYDSAKLDETKAKIALLYKDAGYADCEIEAYPTTDAETNIMTVNFLITENNKIVVGGIKIDGTVAFKEKKIVKLMKTKVKKVFKEDTFRTDIGLIETFYKNNGYMEYKLLDSTITYNDDRTQMLITLSISEGANYKIGNITYGGNEALTDKEITKSLKITKGAQFQQSKIAETLQGVYDLYSDRGYLHAQVVPSFNGDEQTGIVDIDFAIQENAVVYVGNVYIEGLVSTKDKVIRREILVKHGDVLSAGKVRRSIERIYNLGFIEGAEPQILPTQAPDAMDLLFNITEGKPGMITAGAGYSSVDQFVGSIQFQHMNLFGYGQRLNLLWEFGARRQNYEIDWTEPWIFNKNASLTLSAYNIERARDYASVTDAYKESRIGAGVKVGPRISETVGLLFGYSYEFVKLYDIDSRVLSDIQSATDLSKDNTSAVLAQIVFDNRDYVFDPSRGSRHLFALQFAGGPLGGNVNYVKGTAKSTWYFPTFWKFVLSFNVNAAMIGSYGGQKTVPLYEKFYVGGADTIRGYKYRTEIGPENGGTVMGLANVEYKFPIVSDKGKAILQGAFFYDIGGTWDKVSDIDFSLGTGTNNLRSGVGFGIRFATPVFPLRLDWGYGLNHKSGEPLQQFYFTIGNVF
ncbi:outer membrane protein assembly factor BamA [Endomicrobium proavitum]|uniref:Outer membrane protein assembly factor BamA n=1 Tax=Endomicrobium proavitum TaxID=1408281 RepID=A0A0G3WGL7_9BACT|nr:outer membrane protein assembly factor BamA [Endomicrobium proavitum]AKL97826.1 Outer membrane protein assembly factor YaeT [Endomicrobium proavitum]